MFMHIYIYIYIYICTYIDTEPAEARESSSSERTLPAIPSCASGACRRKVTESAP